MSNGLPVIANRLTSCPEVLGENAVLVDRPDAAAWALGLEQLLTDPSRLLRLAAGSKDRSAAFSWERAGQETWTAIEAALEGA
jgi:glycosyltransferase involved in cell wall biosynthesis